ncbi:MAG: glycosyl transferase, partial [Marivirga sp.]|nr:glycosyl transferase [Marivirga sp.]
MNPLVSVVCLCYNHEPYIRQAVESVIHQSYRPLQIIVTDDGSRDGSVREIQKLTDEYPFLEALILTVNSGNCKAFNRAYKLVKGEFVVDFATDDVMMPNRIEKQVEFFQRQNENVGVVFTDATYINEQGTFIRDHFEYLFRKHLISKIPVGNIYREVVSTYFIPGPTMMSKKIVLDTLNGYDEELTYEDFDFWVRSARIYDYAFLNEKLTCIRKVSRSMSTGWYVPGDKQLHSTYLVCRKVQQLNRNEGDKQALIKRIRYEFRQSVISGNFLEGNLFYDFLKELDGIRITDRIIYYINKKRIPLS